MIFYQITSVYIQNFRLWFDLDLVFVHNYSSAYHQNNPELYPLTVFAVSRSYASWFGWFCSLYFWHCIHVTVLMDELVWNIPGRFQCLLENFILKFLYNIYVGFLALTHSNISQIQIGFKIILYIKSLLKIVRVDLWPIGPWVNSMYCLLTFLRKSKCWQYYYHYSCHEHLFTAIKW